MANACSTKTQAEVTKDFVSAASYILSIALGGKNKKAVKKDRGDPLWDTKQLAVSQWFSQTAYLTVRAIEDKRITVENSFGNQMHISRDILEKMDSANHYAKDM